jgi:hypothetical protein
MSTTTITIDVAFLTEEQRDAATLLFARSGGWQATVDGEPNPITAEDYGVTMIAGYLRQRVSEQSAYDAQIAAAQAVSDLLDGVTVTTPAEFDALFPTPPLAPHLV